MGPQQRPRLPSSAPEALPLGRWGAGRLPSRTPLARGGTDNLGLLTQLVAGAGDCRIQNTE